MPAPSSTPIEAAVRVRGLARVFAGGVRALDGIDLAIPPGELVGVIGANGSGKTTLLKVLSGILEPDAGTVEVLGLDPRRGGARLRPRIGYAAQRPALDPEMTGWETLRLFHALYGLPRRARRERLERAVESAGLAPVARRRVATWSGGQRQRLHLALAELHAPRLLLLDEPSAGLDPEGRRDLWRRLAASRDEGSTVVAATHDLADVAAHCDRVLLLKNGRLLADAAPAALVAAHARARAVITLAQGAGERSDALRQALSRLAGAPEVAVEGTTVTLWRDRNPDGGDPALDLLAAQGFPCRGYERHPADLAGAYFRLTGAPPAPRPLRPRLGAGRRG